MFDKVVRKRLDQASWACIALSKVTTPADTKRVKKWLTDNAGGEYYVRTIKETRGKRRFTIATLIRFAEETDALMFKLAWYDYE